MITKIREAQSNIYLRHSTTFDVASVPTSPSSPPSNAKIGDVIIQTYDNGVDEERVTIRWVHNGTTWTVLGHPEYHTRHFNDLIVDNIDLSALPAQPLNYNTSVTTNYLPGDTLHEEYSNAQLDWTFDGVGWLLDYIRSFQATDVVTYVQDYGAVGDGVTDDTAAIQFAINAAPTNGTVHFGNNKTYLTTTLTLAASKRYTGNSTIKLKNSGNTNLILLHNNVILDGLTFDGNRTNQGTPSYLHGTLKGDGKTDITIINCKVINGYGSPIYLKDCAYPRVVNNVITDAIRPAIYLTGACKYYVTEGNRISNILEDGIKVSATWQEDIRTANTLGTITASSSFSGTLAPYVPVVSGLNAISIVVQVSGVTVETFRDNDGDGNLTGSGGGTGTINYTTGAVSLTLTAPLTATIKASWTVANTKDCSNGRIEANVIDYSASALTTAYVDTNVLGIEVWTQNPAYNIQTVKRCKILNNTIIGPSSFTLAGDFFGISCHGSDNAIISDNVVYGGNAIDFGIEAVLSENALVTNNQVRDYIQAGITVPASELHTEWVTVNANNIGPAAKRAAYGVFVNCTSTNSQLMGPVISNNMFYDAGFAGVWFKNTSSNTDGSGRYGRIINNTFVHDNHIEYDADLVTVTSPIYDITLHKTDNVDVLNNKSYSRRTGLSSNQRVFLRIEGTTNCVVSDNIVDGIIPSSGVATTRPAIWVLDASPNTGAGGILIGGNQFSNWQRGVLIENSGGSTATGPACRIINNQYVSVSTSNQYRTTDIVEEYVDTGLSFYIGGKAQFIKYGTGSPEGVVTGNVGDVFLRTDGGVGTTLYIKEAGTGNTGWVAHANSGGGGSADGKLTFGNVGTFNQASVPTSPTSPPGAPISGDTFLEVHNNTTRSGAAIFRWTYNGTTWVQSGTPILNRKAFHDTVASNLTAGALPATPARPGASTDYVTGDTLSEEYNNGRLEWIYSTSSWGLVNSKIATNNTYVIKATTNWDEDGSLPTTPENTPSSPKINDVLIQSYDNTTRNNAVTRYWSYNGTSWVLLTNGTHRFNMMFTNAPGTALTYGVAPTAALAATTTSYVNGDILWEKYTNGYGLYKFNNGSWSLQTYGLEVGRLQDAADFQATLGAGVDGWAVVWDNDISKFTLANI